MLLVIGTEAVDVGNRFFRPFETLLHADLAFSVRVPEPMERDVVVDVGHADLFQAHLGATFHAYLGPPEFLGTYNAPPTGRWNMRTCPSVTNRS